MPKKLSVSEIKAVAEAAITAQHAMEGAKKAHEAAPDDASLKAAFEKASSDHTTAKAAADALSQNQSMTPEQVSKHKRKIAIMTRELEQAGALDDEDINDEGGDDDLDDPTRVVTVGDLRRMKARESKQTAVEMAQAIPDAADSAAVVQALGRLVPSGDSNKDFADAIAIARAGRNSKILEEVARKAPSVQHRSGSGAPPKPAEAEFVPTAEESKYMKGFGLTKEDVLNARAAAQATQK